MPFTFVDRVPSKLGRVKITPESGGAAYYAVIERADDPAQVGTPLSAANLNAAAELGYQSTSSLHTLKRVYIATNGNDANTGESESVPMKTVKAAVQKYAKWHKYLDIYLADGTYTEDIGPISTDQCSLGIRSTSEDKSKVTINMTTSIICHINLLRLYNLTLNVTVTGAQVLAVYAGMVYAYRVRFTQPTASTTSCVNVYNAGSLWLNECVINAGTGAGVYGNEALHIKALNCTSERTLVRGFYANNGAIIEYTPTLTATQMTHAINGGKCMLNNFASGEISSSGGQHLSPDGTLIQWGLVQIKPTALNTPTSLLVEYPIPFSVAPAVVASPSTAAPEVIRVGVSRVGSQITDSTRQVLLTITRTNDTSTTGVFWIAIGKG